MFCHRQEDGTVDSDYRLKHGSYKVCRANPLERKWKSSQNIANEAIPFFEAQIEIELASDEDMNDFLQPVLPEITAYSNIFLHIHALHCCSPDLYLVIIRKVIGTLKEKLKCNDSFLFQSIVDEDFFVELQVPVLASIGEEH